MLKNRVATGLLLLTLLPSPLISYANEKMVGQPSCTQLCRQNKSGKMSRMCSYNCQAETKKCKMSNGEYLLDSGKYRCFTAQEVKNIAKK